MRFWKYLKDELGESKNQESDNNSQAEQEMNDGSMENEEQSKDSSSQESDQPSESQEKQEMNDSSEQSEEQSKDNSSQGTDQPSESQENQEMNDSSMENEEQSKDSSGQESDQPNESQEKQETNDSSMKNEKQSKDSSSQESDQSSESLENQKMNDSSVENEEQSKDNSSQDTDQPSESQEKQEMSENSENSEEQTQGNSSNQESSDSQDEQEMNDSSIQSEEQSKDSSSQESDQPSESQENQEMNDSSLENEEQSKDSSSQDTNQAEQDNNEVTKEQVESVSEEISKNPELTAEQKKELLEKIKNGIKKIRESKAEKLQREHLNAEKQETVESEEEKYELSEQTNNFLNQLSELPSFENRERGAGYSIDTDSYTEVPESIIKILITKFLNQRFCKHSTDLNVRSNSLEKTNGFYKWEIKDVIEHLETHQVTKVLNDKYGYEYAQGKNENVPLSFYFDMSGSMSEYTNMLAVIAIELLKKDVKVLIGYNERVNVQIESIEKNITVSELAKILESAGYSSGWESNGRNSYKKDSSVKYKYIDRNIDNYLIAKKAEKCVVFSDFDPRSEVINLSHAAQVYWFCFEKRYYSYDISKFNGFIYKVQNLRDLEQGLIKVNGKRFETLCYTDNPKELQKKVRVVR